MAAATGLSDTLETAYVTHACGGAAPATLTTPVVLNLVTTTSTNTTFGTIDADTNYVSNQNANLGGSTSNTAGAGAAGFSQRTNTAQISFFGTGAAASQTIVGVTLRDSAGTPTRVGYQNFASNVTVGIGATYVIATGALTFQVS